MLGTCEHIFTRLLTSNIIGEKLKEKEKKKQEEREKKTNKEKTETIDTICIYKNSFNANKLGSYYCITHNRIEFWLSFETI